MPWPSQRMGQPPIVRAAQWEPELCLSSVVSQLGVQVTHAAVAAQMSAMGMRFVRSMIANNADAGSMVTYLVSQWSHTW